jgi:hypothetical protein
VGLRFNPPPGWQVPPDFVPGPGWQPDPSWPPAPPGWSMWVSDDATPGAAGGQFGYQQGPAPGDYQQPQDAFGQQQYPYQQYQAYPYGAQPPKPGTNGLAIASFILGLIGDPLLLGVIFGIIALVQIRRRQQGGRGFAIAGLALSAVWIVVVIAVIVGGGLSVSTNHSGGASRPGQVNIFSLRVGDCFQNPPPSQTALGVTDVSVVSCTTPHNAQAFAQFDATDSSYPGSPALIKESQHGCQTRIKGNLDKSKLTSTMSLRFLFPEAQSWANGRRTITCLVVDSTKDLTSSLLSH